MGQLTSKRPVIGGREMPGWAIIVAIVLWGYGLALLINPVLDDGAPHARAIGICLVVLAFVTVGIFATKRTPSP